MTQQRPDERRAAELSRLMAAYEKDILKLCCLYLRDAGMAEDAAQETFFKAYRALDRFRGECADKTWLVRILLNVCRDELRRRKRELAVEELPETAGEAFDALPLKEAIRRLPAQLRDVIILRYFTGLTLEETAAALELPRGTVSTRQRKALELLKLDLTDEEGAS